MKTKKFFMTSLLVMGMIIAKAANGFAPELVLVSQPVLTYNANSVTVYYDLQNIGDYSYKGDIYLYLDPDNGYYYAKKYVSICPGRIKRVSISIPAYRPNPSWTYTVMPYYELGDDLYSFTTFEYFEPLRFCWYGYHNEPWVVVHIGPRIRTYTRPGDYRYYYDGYRPMIPPPPPGGYAPGHGPGPYAMPPMNPMHHTYGYHHSNGGYPANHHPEGHVPGYNPVAPNHDGPNHDGPGHDGPGHNGNPGHNGGNNNGNNGNNGGATVVPYGSNTPGSTSTNSATNNGGANTSNGNNSGATTRPNSNVNSGSNTNNNNSGATSRPSGNTNNSGNVSRPSGNTNNSGTSRPSGNTNNSGNVSRPSSNTNNSGTTNSGRSGNNSSNSSRSSSGSNNSNSSSSSGSSRGGNNTTPSRSR